MRLPVLILFLVMSASAMGIWSLAQGASMSTAALRMVATLISVEVVYFAILVTLGFVWDTEKTASETSKRQPTSQSKPAYARM